MSVAEFDDTVRAHLINLMRADKKTLANRVGVDAAGSKAYRKSFESAGKHIEVLTDNAINKLVTELAEYAITDESNLSTDVIKFTRQLLSKVSAKDFRRFVLSRLQSTKASVSNITETPGIEISNIPQSNIQNYFAEYINTLIPENRSQKVTITLPATRTHKSVKIEEYADSVVEQSIGYITEHIQAGHLVGVFSIRLAESLGVSSVSVGSTYRDISVSIGDNANKSLETFSKNTLTPILKLLLDADFLTSSVIQNRELAATSVKKVFGSNGEAKASTELQFRLTNADSGSTLIKAGTELNKLIKNLVAGENLATATFTSFVNSLKEVANLVKIEAANLRYSEDSFSKEIARAIEKDTDNIINSLINTKGSPSILDSIDTILSKVLSGSKVSNSITTKSKVKVSKTTKITLPSNAKIKSNIRIVKNLIAKTSKIPKNIVNINIPKSKPIDGLRGINTVNLLAILNSAINEKVAENMGTGSETRVLNYRTGRFAETVSINRVSESRQGMISVFYSYMKNPYATFSEGGRQQYPKTRDPKLLISKSIREIAAPIVGNRLRSVVV